MENNFLDEVPDTTEYKRAKPAPRLEEIFCIRCGSKLILTNINEETLIEHYKCSRERCVHHHCELEFCHPVYPNRGPGESYALAWVK
jgi:hypothetical protein